MPIEYQDLKPRESKIEINSVEFTLRPFSLFAQVWARNHFATESQPDGIVVLSERIQVAEDIEAPVAVAWFLLKDKAHFANKIENFKSAIEKEQHQMLKAMEIRQAIVECLGVSQPQIDEIQEEIELKKQLAAGN